MKGQNKIFYVEQFRKSSFYKGTWYAWVKDALYVWLTLSNVISQIGNLEMILNQIRGHKKLHYHHCKMKRNIDIF